MYDVLTSDRPYRRARDEREARRVLQEAAGPHLDPNVVSALLRSLDQPILHLVPALD
jgi:HD-GYP domain-containing protein (c-di-GMP phosphodiesterase class II)